MDQTNNVEVADIFRTYGDENVELNRCVVAFWITNTTIIDTLSSPPLRYLNFF